MEYQILIADVNQLVRLGIEKVLDQVLSAGYVAHHAQDGIEDLEILNKKRIDLALVNADLPEKDGLQVLVEANEKSLPTKFIIYYLGMSPDSYLAGQIRERSQELGAIALHGNSSVEAFAEAINAYRLLNGSP